MFYFYVLLYVFITDFPSCRSRGSCTYEHVTRTVTCRTRQLLSIPVGIATAALALHVQGRPGELLFTVLARNNFTALRRLRDLALPRCGIEAIRDEAFSELSMLRRLELRGNRLRTLNEDMFDGMAQLEYLGLSENPIQRLHNFAFRGLSSQTLAFDDNPFLEHIACKAFAGARVRSLVLNRCNLSTICSATFRSMRGTLQEVHVTRNLQPLSLPDDVFNGMTLKVLTFSDNGIVDVEFLERLSAEHIRLDGNPLDELHMDDFAELKNTRTLALNNTRMTELNRKDMSKLRNIETLNLRGNRLTVFKAADFVPNNNLVTLDLSGNRLVEIEGDFDDVLPNLEVLLLDGNNVTTLPAKLGPLFSRLRIVTLHDNPLHCNCEWRWFALWVDKHRDIVPEVEKMRCRTPEVRNFSQVSTDVLRCRKPHILNATFDDVGGRLSCTAEGDPAPAVVWLASGNQSVSVTKPLHGSVLTQGVVDITIHGNYTCVASNAAGEDRDVVVTSAIQRPSAKTSDDTSATSRLPGDTPSAMSRDVTILDTPLGFLFTAVLLALLGCLFRYH